MDLSKQYIIQCIITASNNLRLSSEKIEAVAILRERVAKAENLSEELKTFKKITELSKLGVRLGEILAFIENGKIDFAKLSDIFKEQSYSLVKELSYVLDIVTPQMMRELFQKFTNESINVDLTKRPLNEEGEDKLVEIVAKEIKIPKRSTAEELKEELILGDLNKEENFSFEQYESRVLRPVKDLDAFLNRVVKYDYTESEMNTKIKLMKENAELSQKVGFEVLSNMHRIFAAGLDLINQKKIAPSTNVVDSLRASLIVIVAVVRGKEVDITNYLNKAEEFGKTLSQTKKVI